MVSGNHALPQQTMVVETFMRYVAVAMALCGRFIKVLHHRINVNTKLGVLQCARQLVLPNQRNARNEDKIAWVLNHSALQL